MPLTHSDRGFWALSRNGLWRTLGVQTTLAIMLTGFGSPFPARSGSLPMRNIEGEVLSVSHHAGEGSLELLQADLRTTGDDKAVQLLLAPQGVCDEIGFQIVPGDRVRARIFVDDSSSYRVQKIQNVSRGTMVRLRTLHQTPLWNSVGTWEGGPIRTSHGPHRYGQRQRGGGPPG